MDKKLISLAGLTQFLKDLKEWVVNYFDSHIDKVINKESNNPVANSVVSKNIWTGIAADVPAAIASGDIIPGYTNVYITDDDKSEFEWCTKADIYALFGLTI